MAQIPKVAGVLSCAVVLGLGLSNVVTGSAEEFGLSTGVEDMESCTDKNVEREIGVMKCREALAKGIDTIKGEVLSVEGNHYIVKRSDGKQVSLQVDDSTRITKQVRPGEWIQAKVTDGHHALSIGPTQ